jgi:hypothetical protein
VFEDEIRNTKRFDKPFDRHTVLSEAEGLMVLSEAEGLMVLSEAEGQFRMIKIQMTKTRRLCESFGFQTP